jgi:hypothetical protein
MSNLSSILALLASVSAACATAGRDDVPGGPPGQGPEVDAPSAVAPVAQLLLSEIALAPTTGEYIEIVNPSAATVPLDHYYLSDNGDYFKLPAGSPTVTTGDFIVQFPPGATIAPHGVATIALNTAAAFTTAYGTAPTYSIGGGAVDMTKVTSMFPSLTDGGEIVVLFYWDGSAPLVRDIDIMLAGAPTAANGFVNKSGYQQGGGTYGTDADSMPMQSKAPAAGVSTKRIALKAGHVVHGSSNGITGDDETSEMTSATWDTTFSAPTPGVVPTAIQ